MDDKYTILSNEDLAKRFGTTEENLNKLHDSIANQMANHQPLYDAQRTAMINPALEIDPTSTPTYKMDMQIKVLNELLVETRSQNEALTTSNADLKNLLNIKEKEIEDKSKELISANKSSKKSSRAAWIAIWIAILSLIISVAIGLYGTEIKNWLSPVEQQDIPMEDAYNG